MAWRDVYLCIDDWVWTVEYSVLEHWRLQSDALAEQQSGYAVAVFLLYHWYNGTKGCGCSCQGFIRFFPEKDSTKQVVFDNRRDNFYKSLIVNILVFLNSATLLKS